MFCLLKSAHYPTSTDTTPYICLHYLTNDCTCFILNIKQKKYPERSTSMQICGSYFGILLSTYKTSMHFCHFWKRAFVCLFICHSKLHIPAHQLMTDHICRLFTKHQVALFVIQYSHACPIAAWMLSYYQTTEDAYFSGNLVLFNLRTCMCSNVETNMS